MKILLLGAFGPGALEHYYLRGFRKQAINCDTFDITDQYYTAIGKSIVTKAVNKIYPAYFFNGINNSLLEWLKEKKYDVIIVFKGHTLFPSTIARLKEYCSFLNCYNPDHPFIFYSAGSGNKNVSESIRLYDLYLSYSQNIAEALRERFGVASAVIPFGYDDEAPLAKSAPVEVVNKFLLIGAYDKQRSEMIEWLQTEKLVIYGDDKWAHRTDGSSRSRKFYANKALYGQQYVDAIAGGAGVFNFLRTQNISEGSHNMRTFEVPGYGGLMISQRTPEQESFFEDNKEAVYFGNRDELNDKIRFIESNPAFADSIKKNAFLKCRQMGFGYNQRAVQWVEILKTTLGSAISK